MHPCTKRLTIGGSIVLAIIVALFAGFKTHYQQQRTVEIDMMQVQATVIESPRKTDS